MERGMMNMCMTCNHAFKEHDHSGGAKANSPCTMDKCNCKNFMPKARKL